MTLEARQYTIKMFVKYINIEIFFNETMFTIDRICKIHRKFSLSLSLSLSLPPLLDFSWSVFRLCSYFDGRMQAVRDSISSEVSIWKTYDFWYFSRIDFGPILHFISS